jgi:hypothetical protein
VIDRPKQTFITNTRAPHEQDVTLQPVGNGGVIGSRSPFKPLVIIGEGGFPIAPRSAEFHLQATELDPLAATNVLLTRASPDQLGSSTAPQHPILDTIPSLIKDNKEKDNPMPNSQTSSGAGRSSSQPMPLPGQVFPSAGAVSSSQDERYQENEDIPCGQLHVSVRAGEYTSPVVKDSSAARGSTKPNIADGQSPTNPRHGVVADIDVPSLLGLNRVPVHEIPTQLPGVVASDSDRNATKKRKLTLTTEFSSLMVGNQLGDETLGSLLSMPCE